MKRRRPERRRMLLCLAMVSFGTVLLALPPGASAQTAFARTPEQFQLSFLAVVYGEGTASVKFEATERLPRASGEAKIERKGGVTQIEIELDEMKPAWSFGGDFNTYLLWAISPEGHMDNLGEFILKGNRSKLDVSTPMDTFGLLVSAEPHFMVENPSAFVVLRNLVPGRRTSRPAEGVTVEIVSVHPTYRYERTTLAEEPEAGGEIRTALRQAHVAVQLAERAGAGQLAADAFREAEISLLMAEGAAETRSQAHEDVELMARRTVRLAAAAERLASGSGNNPRQATVP